MDAKSLRNNVPYFIHCRGGAVRHCHLAITGKGVAEEGNQQKPGVACCRQQLLSTVIGREVSSPVRARLCLCARPPNPCVQLSYVFGFRSLNSSNRLSGQAQRPGGIGHVPVPRLRRPEGALRQTRILGFAKGEADGHGVLDPFTSFGRAGQSVLGSCRASGRALGPSRNGGAGAVLCSAFWPQGRGT